MNLIHGSFNHNSFKFVAIWFVIIFIVNFKLHAQTKDDIKTVSNLIEAPMHRPYYAFDMGDKNVMQAMSRVLFAIYKNYISSQDANHCSFYPSCSEYALQSVKKNGFFIGLLITFDRLSRCNGLNNDKYPKKKGSNLLYDPVQ